MRYSLLLIIIAAFLTATTFAQTSAPKRPPSTTPSQSPDVQRSTAVPETNSSGVLQSKVINGIEVKLLEVKGNAADQTVHVVFKLTNPKGNAQVVVENELAIDTDGDAYQRSENGFNEVLYTDVARKVIRGVKGVPSKIKTLALFKFVLFNQNGGQYVTGEFRNLNIDWQ